MARSGPREWPDVEFIRDPVQALKESNACAETK
jgi:hypothetical protein